MNSPTPPLTRQAATKKGSKRCGWYGLIYKFGDSSCICFFVAAIFSLFFPGHRNTIWLFSRRRTHQCDFFAAPHSENACYFHTGIPKSHDQPTYCALTFCPRTDIFSNSLYDTTMMTIYFFGRWQLTSCVGIVMCVIFAR